MKKYLILFLFIFFYLTVCGQTYKIINGDKRYMDSTFKYPETWWFFKSDLQDGKWICYYDSAMTKINYVMHRKDGKKDGFGFSYRKNGSIASLYYYKNDNLNGEYRGYHKNGQLRSKGFYYNHRSIGEYVAYDSLGKVIRLDTTPIPKGVSYRKPFIPETSVNKIFILNDSTFSQEIFSTHKKENFKLLLQGTNLLFNNASKNQYLMVYWNETNGNKKISCFEIGYTKSLISKEEYIELNYPFFLTESGIKLGMTRNQLLAIKGTDFYIMTETEAKYIIDVSGKIMTNQNEEIEYILECEFKDDKIIKITFGQCACGDKRQEVRD